MSHLSPNMMRNSVWNFSALPSLRHIFSIYPAAWKKHSGLPGQLLLKIVLAIALTGVTNSLAMVQHESSSSPNILIINSYHEGNQWSDNEVHGIETILYGHYPHANIQVAYMDTKRNFSTTRFEELRILYEGKYKDKQFDLLISTDDNAFNFLKRYRKRIFGDTPLVFCGVNRFQRKMLAGMKNITGVAEHYSMVETLEMINRLQPGLKKLAVIADLTPSSFLMIQQLEETLTHFPHTFSIEMFKGIPRDELEKQLFHLSSPDSAVLMLNYFRDSNETYYKPAEVMQSIAHASNVPVYGFSDYYMNYGLTGGVLTEGYTHGTCAGEIATRILAGQSADSIPVVTNLRGRTVFDHRQMSRFKLPPSALPPEAVLLNVKRGNQKDILILHSYHPGFLWTSRISQGLTAGLAGRQDIGEVFIEYMDTKRYNDPAYLHQLYQIYQKKYAHRSLDLIIVSDDTAFTFARKFRNLLFNNVPIVFCGVNYLDDPQKINQENITGVLESSDMAGTLNAMLRIYPDTRKILVINDKTTTGQQFHRRLNMLLPQLDKQVQLEFTYDLTMAQILKKVANLDPDTGVFFISLIRDGRNQRYQLQESVRLISSASNRPVFGLVESHLRNGIVGGSITYGDDHGRIAAGLASRIMDGEQAEEIAIVQNSPHRFMFSYPRLKRYQISTDYLPPDSTLVDAPTTLFYQHKRGIILVCVVLCLLLLLVVVQQFRVRREAKNKQRAESKARIDDMTGTINRSYFEREVEPLLKKYHHNDQQISFCYADIDQLKYVNDTFGHQEGDRYIIEMADLLKSAIRSNDSIYRMGGDEFMIVFENCDIKQAHKRIDTVRQELASLNSRDKKRYLRSISFGISFFSPKYPTDINRILEQADHLMYLEKKEAETNFTSVN